MDERSGPKSVRGKNPNLCDIFFMYFTASTDKVFVWIFQMLVVIKWNRRVVSILGLEYNRKY